MLVVANGRISVFLNAEIYLTFSLFTYTSTHIELVSIPWLLWIMRRWTWEYRLSLHDSDFVSFGYIPRRLLDHMVVLFLSSWGTSILPSIVAALIYSHLHCTRVPFSPHSHQHFVISCLFDNKHPNKCELSSFTQSCLTLWDPMDCCTSGCSVHHQLLELAQTYVRWVGDAIQPSHPLSSPFCPVFNLSQHQGIF